MRYSKLHHAVSQVSSDVVHARTLTCTLTHLQEEGLVDHHQDAHAADYRLTAAGTALVDFLAELGRRKREPRTDEGGEDDD